MAGAGCAVDGGFVTVMAGHSRLKDGVASARLCPTIHVLRYRNKQDVDARHKAGHDGGKIETYFPTPPLLSKNTPCSPNMFQTHQGRVSGTGRP